MVEIAGNAFVQQDLHAVTGVNKADSELSGIRRAKSPLARHRGKALQKFFERVIVFQIFEQSLHRHARTLEYRRTAEDIPVNGDEIVRIHTNNLTQIMSGSKSSI